MTLFDTTINFILYIVFAIVLAALSIKIGPWMFKLSKYNITASKTITGSDAVSYFLQALVAVVLGFIALRSRHKITYAPPSFLGLKV